MNINVTDYCASGNSSIGVIEALRNIENGDTLVFPTGEYHFYKDFSIHKVCHMTNTDSFKSPDKYFAIEIDDKKDIIIDGCNSTFVIHGDMCAFAMFNCDNIKLKNFTIRYNSPTNFEMKVIKKSLNKITYKIPPKSLFYIENNKLVFFEQSPFTKRIITHIKLMRNVPVMLFIGEIVYSELCFHLLKLQKRLKEPI